MEGDNDPFERIADGSGEAFVVKGTKVRGVDWFARLFAKGSLSAIPDDYPAVGREQATAALAFASLRLSELHHET